MKTLFRSFVLIVAVILMVAAIVTVVTNYYDPFMDALSKWPDFWVNVLAIVFMIGTMGIIAGILFGLILWILKGIDVE